MSMDHYVYDGSVLSMGHIIDNNWKAETYAVSDKKAATNLCYQFKKQNKLENSYKVTLALTPVKD